MRNQDVAQETLIGFKQGKKLADTAPSSSTITRWAKSGVNARDKGSRITLEYCYIGGRLYTSVEAYGRWIAKLNGG